VWGPTRLTIPARLAALRTIRAAPCRSSRRPSAVRKIGPSRRSPIAGSIARGARGERDRDHLAALARDHQGPVAALDTKVLDIGARGLRHPQPIQRQQGDQRVLGGQAEPGCDTQRAELVLWPSPSRPQPDLYHELRGSLCYVHKLVPAARVAATGWPGPRAGFGPRGEGCISPPSPTGPPENTALACAGGALRTTAGGAMVLTDIPAHPASRRSARGPRRPTELRPGKPGTELAPTAWESGHSLQSALPARTIGLRPGGGQCWVCGQMGRADPPATAYFCCDGCDVRWYGGTRRPRRSPQFTQREYTWWMAGKLARIRYIDHAAEHTACPA